MRASRSAAKLEQRLRSAHNAPGREGLFNLTKSLPPTLRYEPGLVLAEGDFGIARGRFSGFGESVNWIVADILQIEDGVLVEHWDVIQDEATKEQSKSGNSMFGDSFPIYQSRSCLVISAIGWSERFPRNCKNFARLLR